MTEIIHTHQKDKKKIKIIKEKSRKKGYMYRIDSVVLEIKSDNIFVR